MSYDGTCGSCKFWQSHSDGRRSTVSNFGMCFNTKGNPSRGNGRSNVNDDEGCGNGEYGTFYGDKIVRGDDMIPVTAGEFNQLRADVRSLAASYLSILAWQQAGKDLRRAVDDVKELERIAETEYVGSWG